MKTLRFKAYVLMKIVLIKIWARFCSEPKRFFILMILEYSGLKDLLKKDNGMGKYKLTNNSKIK